MYSISNPFRHFTNSHRPCIKFAIKDLTNTSSGHSWFANLFSEDIRDNKPLFLVSLEASLTSISKMLKQLFSGTCIECECNWKICAEPTLSALHNAQATHHKLSLN